MTSELPQSPELTVQIVNFNTKEYLRKCLTSLFADVENSGIADKIEVRVLDNASNDDLTDLSEEFQGKVHFSKSQENKGFGAGHNQLAKDALGDDLLILNPDTEFIQPNTIKRLMDKMNKHKGKAIIGPALVTEKGDRQVWDHGEFRFGKSIPGMPAWHALTEEQKVQYVSGAIFMIDRFAFNELGGFDEEFFLYDEEVDLDLRAKKELNIDTIYDPSIEVKHIGSVVGGKDKGNNGGYFFDSNKHFFKKYYPGLSPLIDWVFSRKFIQKMIMGIQ